MHNEMNKLFHDSAMLNQQWTDLFKAPLEKRCKRMLNSRFTWLLLATHIKTRSVMIRIDFQLQLERKDIKKH